MVSAQSIRQPYAELEDATEQLVTLTVTYNTLQLTTASGASSSNGVEHGLKQACLTWQKLYESCLPQSGKFEQRSKAVKQSARGPSGDVRNAGQLNKASPHGPRSLSRL
ncbi:hypothetical protein AC579_738 [Pseudocercospora musae]|uniref:Uncharacterized protein n=1 Tax=Pseudocercospora musae TaxID=113226 RepID=A0A139I9J0_9PEZI|nr:hypothetical protein AC579_738 [Pseudocercospora musae]